jgi:hypothetical protein
MIEALGGINQAGIIGLLGAAVGFMRPAVTAHLELDSAILRL